MNEINSLYMHFPFCKHLCNYCDFYKFVPSSKSEIESHQEKLKENFNAVTNLHHNQGYSWGSLDTFYLGGGTPSLWGSDGAEFLKNALKEWGIKFSDQGEFTSEFNPGSLTEKMLNSFREIGFNRFSVGMQSLNPFFIKTLDRIHSLEDCFEILKLMKRSKVNFSIDLMIGLPYSVEQKRDVIEELKNALEYNPSHFSVYILTIKDSYKHPLPDENYIADEYLAVADFLKSQGFGHYEVSNFSLPGKESRHNLKYWNSESVAALGPSATGFLSEKKLRYKVGSDYQKLNMEKLTDEEFYLEKIYMKLRSSIGIDWNDLNNIEQKKKLVLEWKNQNLIEALDDKGFRLNSKGYMLIDSLVTQL